MADADGRRARQMSRDWPIKAPDMAAVEAAGARIAPHIHRTPVLASRRLDALAGAELLFKCENFQRIGAFKARGAMNAVLSLSDEAARPGIVTHSSGNHGLAVALAAATRGVPATIVMPRGASAPKRAGVAALGARIVECAPTLAAREETAAALVARTGGAFVHPFADPAVIAGQGTAALELLDYAGPLDALTCPVGGGGLLAGTAIVRRGRAPGARLVAAEPVTADDAAAGFRSGRLEPQRLPVATIADGLATAMSPLTHAIMLAGVDQVVTVPDEAIARAMRLVMDTLKIVIEPSCAVPVAAMLEGAWRPRGRVGVILTGGNVDLDRLPWTTR